jgi:beta-lactamase superfamily II metal-dependent hydrolase
MSIFKNKRLFVLPFLLLALIFFVFGCGDTSSDTSTDLTSPTTETVDIEQTDNNQNADEPASPDEPADEDKSTTPSGQMKVHIINVGQGDSILIQFHNGQTMLIDAGPDDSVLSYLNQQGIKKINYLVATHPHADHIGGMAAVIRTFDIEKVYMPRVGHTTKTYENVLLAIKSKGLKITSAKAGVTILDQNGLKANFIAPCSSSYDNLNNYSAVIKIQYGNTSFLLTGDAEAESEQQMLVSGTNLKADVLKVGHHGSNSSTTSSFIKAVSPKYAVISCGAGNQYGHPHQEVLSRLANTGVKTYRADTDGTVIFISDGKTFTVKTLGGSIQPRAPNTSDNKAAQSTAQTSGNFIGNKNTKKFHKPACSSLPAEHNRVYFKTRDEAVGEGYVPCKRCNP